MQLTGGYVSNQYGSINVRALSGTASLDAASNVYNYGQMNLQNANVAFLSGMSNFGSMNVSFGNTAISGAVANYGKIILSGNGNTSFYDSVDVQSGAELRVSAGSNAVFFGPVYQRTGALLSGTGNTQYEGGLTVGGSPGFGSNAGNVTFGAANSYLEEIGGVTACDATRCLEGALTQDSSFTRYVVAGKLSFGGTLRIVSWKGFVVKPGQSFAIFGWGITDGQFTILDASGLLLAPGALLDTSQLYSAGILSVAAVPEPGQWAMLLAGLCIMADVARRRSGSAA